MFIWVNFHEFQRQLMKRRHADFLAKKRTEIPSIDTHINCLWNSFQINQIEKSQFVKMVLLQDVNCRYLVQKLWKSEFLHWHVKISSSSVFYEQCIHFTESLNMWNDQFSKRLTDLFWLATTLLMLRAQCRDCYWQQPAAHKLWVAKI